MKTIDSVGVTFVNTVISRGAFNGNVNLTFGTALFSPFEDPKTKEFVIQADTVISARLRMDIECAKELYATLGSLLEALGQRPEDGPVTDVLTEATLEGKPN